ncbi:MAG: division/cell wall cluster transcriptional repressor MraZ [Bifidobacteriaceae bacterium]|jgi:MraZ protein|nr:division/cell wall cluster transcriptional repressor MraZ [Bifidobacteriaceae bacterium]
MSEILEGMLLGTFSPKFDEKGRIILPARFRDVFRDGLVIAPGQEYCLYVYSASEFKRIAAAISGQAVASRDERAYNRILFSGAMDTVPDKQGRIPIPRVLRDYAKLTSEIVCIGVGKRAEIWDKEQWEEYSKQHEEAFADATEAIFES